MRGLASQIRTRVFNPPIPRFGTTLDDDTEPWLVAFFFLNGPILVIHTKRLRLALQDTPDDEGRW